MVFLAIAQCQTTAIAGTDAPTNTLKADILRCGPNSLLVFLILSGHPGVTLEQLEDIPVSSDGTSLLALRDAARKFGIEADIRRYSPEKVDSVPLPAIVQFRNPDNSFTKYHFNVLYKVDATGYHVIDGTTGSQCSGQKSRLPDVWTGYAMAEKRSARVLMTNGRTAVLLAAWLLTVVVMILTFCTRRPRRAVKYSNSLSEISLER